MKTNKEHNPEVGDNCPECGSTLFLHYVGHKHTDVNGFVQSVIVEHLECQVCNEKFYPARPWVGRVSANEQ
jgi:hypothetical protein